MLSSKSRAVLAAVALTVACSNDSPTDPPPSSGDGGVVRFSYSGSGLNGAFAAKGALNPDPAVDPASQSFAVALDFGASGGTPFYEVVALNVGSPKLDLLGILLSSQKTGSYPVVTTDSCVGPSLETACALAWFILGYDPQDSIAPREYILTSGTVQVTSAANARLKGTFQGVAREVVDGGGSTGPFVPNVSVEVVSGTFDVPVVANQGWIMLPNRLPTDVASLLSVGRRPALSAWGGGGEVRRVR